jgi:hypothetical protein
MERYIGDNIARLMTRGVRRWHWAPHLVPPFFTTTTLRTSARIDDADVMRAARTLQLAQRSDYTTAVKTLRNFWGVLSWAPRAVLRWMGVSRPAVSLAAPLPWRQPWSRAQFHPVAVPDVLNVLSLVDAPPHNTLPR